MNITSNMRSDIKREIDNMNCCDKECRYREFNGGDEISDFYYCGLVGIEVNRGEDMCLLDRYILTPKAENLLDKLSKGLDNVNHPSHYTFGKYEVLDVIEDWDLPFHLANVIKYIARAKHKGNEIQDLLKAQFYLNRYVDIKKTKEGEKFCEEID